MNNADPLHPLRNAILHGAYQGGPVGLGLVRGAVRTLLDNTLAGVCPHDEWSVQGFGMLRLYLDDDRNFRLHVWHDQYRVDDVSDIHTHPWDLTSLIVAGEVTNERFAEAPNREQRGSVNKLLITCGCDAAPQAAPEPVTLRPLSSEVYRPGARYAQHAHEIHRTEYLNGTVTVISRDRRDLPDQAYRFYRDAWIDAIPRPAESLDDIRTALRAARGWMDDDTDLSERVVF